MPTITSSNVANAIVKLVAVDALPALVGNLVMGNLVNRDFEPSLAQAGDTINVPIPPVLTANNIAEGGNVLMQSPNLGNAQIVLNTHAEATFQIPDVTKVLAVPDLLKLYMQPAVVALAEKIESDILALYSQFSLNAAVGSAGTALTEATVDAAETALFQAKVPASQPKYLIVDPTAYSQLRQIPRFSEFSFRRRGGAEGAGRRQRGQDQRLLRVPLTVHQQDRKRSRNYSQPGLYQGRNRLGDPPVAAASGWHGRHRRICRDGQLRDAGGDDLRTQHTGAAVHRRRALRRRGAAEQVRSPGKQLTGERASLRSGARRFPRAKENQ